MNLTKRFRACLLAAVFLVGFLSATAALAAPITYTFTGKGDGTWGVESFFDVFFEVTLPGDTSNVINPYTQVWQNRNLTGTIDITGLGAGTFTLPLFVFVNNLDNLVGICDNATSDYRLVIWKSGVGLDTYDLKTSFGPLTLPDDYGLDITNVETSKGPLTFTDSRTGSFAFTAEAVPAPTTLMLLGSGLLSLLGYGWRQGRERR